MVDTVEAKDLVLAGIEIAEEPPDGAVGRHVDIEFLVHHVLPHMDVQHPPDQQFPLRPEGERHLAHAFEGAGASAMRGAGMVTEAAVVRPAASTSETSGGKSMAQVFMASASASSTMLTTKDPAAPMCRVVSFGAWSGLCCRPSTTSGGASENTLKNEKGAAFTTPPGPSVETSAMGRGTTSEQRIL